MNMISIPFTEAEEKRLLTPVFVAWHRSVRAQKLNVNAISHGGYMWKAGMISLMIDKAEWDRIKEEGPLE